MSALPTTIVFWPSTQVEFSCGIVTGLSGKLPKVMRGRYAKLTHECGRRLLVNLETAEKTYLKGSGVMCPRDGFVVFQNSTLMCGRLGKVTLGGGNKSGLFQALPFASSFFT